MVSYNTEFAVSFPDSVVLILIVVDDGLVLDLIRLF